MIFSTIRNKCSYFFKTFWIFKHKIWCKNYGDHQYTSKQNVHETHTAYQNKTTPYVPYVLMRHRRTSNRSIKTDIGGQFQADDPLSNIDLNKIIYANDQSINQGEYIPYNGGSFDRGGATVSYDSSSSSDSSSSD